MIQELRSSVIAYYFQFIYTFNVEKEHIKYVLRKYRPSHLMWGIEGL